MLFLHRPASTLGEKRHDNVGESIASLLSTLYIVISCVYLIHGITGFRLWSPTK